MSNLPTLTGPKFLPDGMSRNPIHCGSIEHKMGIKGASTCVMNFDGATGFLIGEAKALLSDQEVRPSAQ